MNRWMRQVGGALALTLGIASYAQAQRAGGPPDQQQSGVGGVISGRVLHAATQKPVPVAQVYLVGAQVGTITNAEGVYTIPWGASNGVLPGTRTLRVQHVGY